MKVHLLIESHTVNLGGYDPNDRWTKLGEVPSVEFIDSHKDLVRIQVTEATFGRGFVGIIFPEEACPEVELLSFPSLELARFLREQQGEGTA